MSCMLMCSSQFEQYTNHPVVHVDTCKVAMEPCNDHSHHRPPCVWALTNAHLSLKVCFFSDVKAFWVPCIFDRDDFFYFFHS